MRLGVMAAVVAGLGLGMAGCATAQTPPPELTWMVLNELNGAYFNRAEPMNRPPIVTEIPEGVLRAVDVSHDGTPDWLVDYTETGMNYCGTGGCLQTLYVSDGDAYVMAFDEQALSFDIGERGGETVIDAGVHHTFCVPDDWDCAYAFVWDKDLLQLVERPNARGVTLLTTGIEPIGVRDTFAAPDNLPLELGELWHTTRLTCATTNNDDGFEVRRAEFRDTPDLNGDGRRDWIMTPPYACPDPASDEEMLWPAFSVFTTSGDSLVESYVSPPGRWAAIDIAKSPAAVMVAESCGYGSDCVFQRLAWDPEFDQLKPVD